MSHLSEFAKEVEATVRAIPFGKVLTYGEVASMAGQPSWARQVGHILGGFGFESDLPCHRVVNSQGRTAPHWPQQIDLLKAEGVTFKKSLLVDMAKHHWHPFDEEY